MKEYELLRVGLNPPGANVTRHMKGIKIFKKYAVINYLMTSLIDLYFW